MLQKLTMSARTVAGVLQVVGLSAVSAGVAMFEPAAGLITAGVSAVVLGVAVERSAG